MLSVKSRFITYTGPSRNPLRIARNGTNTRAKGSSDGDSTSAPPCSPMARGQQDEKVSVESGKGSRAYAKYHRESWGGANSVANHCACQTLEPLSLIPPESEHPIICLALILHAPLVSVSGKTLLRAPPQDTGDTWRRRQ
ncbi:hypothetical protein RRG08_031330 [Elysia crispata]|uniref:Uncharacterized protein n=1 Tax=Elysia crispata TaxID=231223 RepID=A0AAE1CZX5_9GAST|nr:hypothetical protein RRG08_031330 [Elysia crispata]